MVVDREEISTEPAASLLWPHLPIKPQAPMTIMTKRATLHPKELWDVTVRLSHDLQALKHKHTCTTYTLSHEALARFSLEEASSKTYFFVPRQ